MNFKLKGFAIIVGIIAVSVTVYLISISQSNRDIDGIQCNQMEQAIFHIHAHLDVYVDGQHRIVPALIGVIPNSCLYWLHTHDFMGIIHIESPEYKTFTLGQFLDIWSKTSENRGVPTTIPKAYVNGKEFNGDYRSIQFSAHDEIVLVYGLPPSSIPSFFDFPQGL